MFRAVVQASTAKNVRSDLASLAPNLTYHIWSYSHIFIDFFDVSVYIRNRALRKMTIIEVLNQFDDQLTKEKVEFNGIVVGASALVLLGIIDRMTRDIDLINNSIPQKVRDQIEIFAKKNIGLDSNWINCSSAVLRKNLQPGWESRLREIFRGKSLRLQTLSRKDLLITKLIGYCDRGTDIYDCIGMKPSQKELKTSFHWVRQQDSEKRWPKHVQKCFVELSRRLNYELSEEDFPL